MRAVNRIMTIIISIRGPIPTATQLPSITCLKPGRLYSPSKKYITLIARKGSAAKVNSTPWYLAAVIYARDLAASIAIKPQKVTNVVIRKTDPIIPQARISIHLPTMTVTKLIKIGKRKKWSAKRIALGYFDFPGPILPACPLYDPRKRPLVSCSQVMEAI